jgi:DNA-binding beta-propeller fold protein YncE
METTATPADATILGTGDFRYRFQPWPNVPPEMRIGDVGGISVDANDFVYVFNRGEHPMMVFDRNGEFVRSWGEGQFTRPHGIDIGPDARIYCTDDGDHTVRVFTEQGRRLLEVGTPGQASAPMSGLPFNRCTHTAVAHDGGFYVADGYGNSRIHKYADDGRLIFSWGQPGIGPGEFNVPHAIVSDERGWVYVADRESHRIQVFDGNGRFQEQWNGLHRPCAFCSNRVRDRFFVGEAGPGLAVNRNTPNLGPRVSIVNRKGEILARLGNSLAGVGPGRFIAPHGIAVDSRGIIYIGEVAGRAWSQLFPDTVEPADLRVTCKLVPVLLG